LRAPTSPSSEVRPELLVAMGPLVRPSSLRLPPPVEAAELEEHLRDAREEVDDDDEVAIVIAQLPPSAAIR